MIYNDTIVLLHGFIKKSQKIPPKELELAKKEGNNWRQDMKKNKHLGSNFDDFLKEEGLIDEAEAVAIKRVLVYKLLKAIERHHVSKTTMAKKMQTSRAALDRLLDPNNTSVTLNTIVNAAKCLDQRISINFH